MLPLAFFLLLLQGIAEFARILGASSKLVQEDAQ
jgi:TRAP-type mannitol/chloroaromatic compound transport system permease small subunit